jgi:MoxR-like ATPase
MSEHAEEEASLDSQIQAASRIIEKILLEVGKEVIGQEHLCSRLLLALLTEGHILLEGVPGLAKTLSIRTLASALDAKFQRIQFTPDLLPADLIGTEIFRPQDGSFEIRRGPVFANLILADEINRAPAKVQSALLEAMQERQVTIGDASLTLPEPFMVMATQNPIEQEGTYPLPEAQIDRFLMKVKVSYPAPTDEKKMLDIAARKLDARPLAQKAASLDDIRTLRELCYQIYVDDRVKRYIVDLVYATREPEKHGLRLKPLIELGASPRATISLLTASRAQALLSGEKHVFPQMVKDVALDVLRHRIIPTYEAEAQGLSSDEIVQQVLDGVEVP